MFVKNNVKNLIYLINIYIHKKIFEFTIDSLLECTFRKPNVLNLNMFVLGTLFRIAVLSVLVFVYYTIYIAINPGGSLNFGSFSYLSQFLSFNTLVISILVFYL